MDQNLQVVSIKNLFIKQYKPHKIMVNTIKLRKKITYLLIFCLYGLNIFFCDTTYAQGYQIKTIVLDAGHGGHDTGARGPSGALEKNVALQVVLLLGKKIEKAYPSVKVIYTRKTDEFIPLYERAAIANRNKADLFISVHCNSSTSRDAHGTETFVLGQHKTKDQMDVAMRENSVIELENNKEDMYDGFDPNSPESMILLSLNLNAYIEQSMSLAFDIQDQYTHELHKTNRGVKQAGFVVLYRTTMPSVLTEIGFISNPQEEKLLVSDKGQEDIAEALFQTFKNYKNKMENGLKGTDKPKEQKKEEIRPNEEIKKEQPKVIDTDSFQKQSTDQNKTHQPDLIYKIQIAVTSKKLNIGIRPYSSIKELSYEKHNNIYKYLSGSYTNYKDAKEELEIVRRLGFKDAFIVVYKQGDRLSPSDAKIFMQ